MYPKFSGARAVARNSCLGGNNPKWSSGSTGTEMARQCVVPRSARACKAAPPPLSRLPLDSLSLAGILVDDIIGKVNVIEQPHKESLWGEERPSSPRRASPFPTRCEKDIEPVLLVNPGRRRETILAPALFTSRAYREPGGRYQAPWEKRGEGGNARRMAGHPHHRRSAVQRSHCRWREPARGAHERTSYYSAIPWSLVARSE